MSSKKTRPQPCCQISCISIYNQHKSVSTQLKVVVTVAAGINVSAPISCYHTLCVLMLQIHNVSYSCFWVWNVILSQSSSSTNIPCWAIAVTCDITAAPLCIRSPWLRRKFTDVRLTSRPACCRSEDNNSRYCLYVHQQISSSMHHFTYQGGFGAEPTNNSCCCSSIIAF